LALFASLVEWLVVSSGGNPANEKTPRNVTGVIIWLKKRNARRISRDKRARLEEEVNG